MDRPIAGDREVTDAAPERIRAAQDEPRVEHVAQAAAVGAVEGGGELDALAEGRFGLLAQPRRQRFAAVHQALACQGAQPRIVEGLQQAGSTGADADVLHRGGAREQALGGAQQAAPVGALFVVAGLQGPDPLSQPGQQATALAEAAKDRLAEVDMALDETGKDETAADIEDAPVLGSRQLGAEGGDAAIAHQDVGLAHRCFGVESEERSAAEQERVATVRGEVGGHRTPIVAAVDWQQCSKSGFDCGREALR